MVLILAFKHLLYTKYYIRCLIYITSSNPDNSAISFKYYHSHFTNEWAEALGVPKLIQRHTGSNWESQDSN